MPLDPLGYSINTYNNGYIFVLLENINIMDTFLFYKRTLI